MTDIIKPSKYHRTIDGAKLAFARDEKGLTQARFAALCHWSTSYQCQLESPGEHEVPTSTAETIYNVFSELQ